MNESREYAIYRNMLNTLPDVQINEDLSFSCQSQKNELFFYLASELVKTNASNPIPENKPGYTEYNDLVFFYNMWPEDRPECAFKKRFLLAAYMLCITCPENIFAHSENETPDFVSLEELQEDEYRAAEAEDIASETYVPVVKTVSYEGEHHVMGVLPFEEDFAIDEYKDEPKQTKNIKPKWLNKQNKKR